MQTISPTITTLILGAVIAGIGFLLRSEKEHSREIERQLSEKKYDVYRTLMDRFDIVLHGNETQRQDNVPHLNEVNRKLIFYGSDEVINSYQEYLKLATSVEANENIDVLDSDARKLINKKFEIVIGNVLQAIRQDMGNRKTKITSDDLFYQFDLVINKTGQDGF